MMHSAGAELPIALCEGIAGFALRLAPGGCIYSALPSLKIERNALAEGVILVITGEKGML